MPGMFLPRPPDVTSATSGKEVTESEQAAESKTSGGVSKPSSSNCRGSRPRNKPAATTTASDKEAIKSEKAAESKMSDGLSKPGSSNHRGSTPRNKYRGRNSRGQVDNNSQWVVKDNGNAK